MSKEVDCDLLLSLFFVIINIARLSGISFHADEESGFCFADIQEIYIESEYRQMGLASELFFYSENLARKNGAKVIRSGTGRENTSSVQLHKKLEYYQYRYEFEKLL
ncbi:MAG: GNAT family N-acetyltransferase [Oscillospiraceae bacterium]|nr:GNAT family N-acetyltransferase [Oscillospiraceae bacterium]